MPVQPSFNYREAGELLRRGWSRRRVAQRYGVTVSVLGVAIQRGHVTVPVRRPGRPGPGDAAERLHTWTALVEQHRRERGEDAVLPRPAVTSERLPRPATTGRHLRLVPDPD